MICRPCHLQQKFQEMIWNAWKKPTHLNVAFSILILLILLLGVFALLAFPNTPAPIMYSLLKLVMHIKEVFSRYWAKTLQENMQGLGFCHVCECPYMTTRSYSIYNWLSWHVPNHFDEAGKWVMHPSVPARCRWRPWKATTSATDPRTNFLENWQSTSHTVNSQYSQP